MNPAGSRVLKQPSALLILLAAVLGASGGCQPSGQPTYSINFRAEAGSDYVEIAWTVQPKLDSMQLEIVGADGTSTTLTTEGVSRFRHEGLQEGQDYAYRLISNSEVPARPITAFMHVRTGPVPSPPEQATVIQRDGRRLLLWSPRQGVTTYRVYYARERTALEGHALLAPFIEVAGGEIWLSGAIAAQEYYYALRSADSSRISPTGPIAFPVQFDMVLNPPARIPATLLDFNGDGCIDIAYAIGDCRGAFRTTPRLPTGLEALHAHGRINNDMKFADFNADGIVDIYANAYESNDSPRSRSLLLLGQRPQYTPPPSAGATEALLSKILAPRYAIDPGIMGLDIGGFGESAQAFDIDNDGDLDIYDPHYWHRQDGGRAWLLINDGSGRFTDIADQAGLNSWPSLFAYYPYVPEGTQVLDWNSDGYLDLFVASSLFLNLGDRRLFPLTTDIGLDPELDEGASFEDFDRDGDLDLVRLGPFATRVYWNTSGRFTFSEVIDTSETYTYGLTTCDLNADGWVDIVTSNRASTGDGAPRIFLNHQGSFHRTALDVPPPLPHGLLACDDVNRDGAGDVLISNSRNWITLRSRFVGGETIRIRVVDAQGQMNQFGRKVIVTSPNPGSRPLIRFVDGGSGYRAQKSYVIEVPAEQTGDHAVQVEFAIGSVTQMAQPGHEVTISPAGLVSSRPQ